jgi:hypothetical protein
LTMMYMPAIAATVRSMRCRQACRIHSTSLVCTYAYNAGNLYTQKPHGNRPHIGILLISSSVQ